MTGVLINLLNTVGVGETSYTSVTTQEDLPKIYVNPLFVCLKHWFIKTNQLCSISMATDSVQRQTVDAFHSVMSSAMWLWISDAWKSTLQLIPKTLKGSWLMFIFSFILNIKSILIMFRNFKKVLHLLFVHFQSWQIVLMGILSFQTRSNCSHGRVFEQISHFVVSLCRKSDERIRYIAFKSNFDTIWDEKQIAYVCYSSMECHVLKWFRKEGSYEMFKTLALQRGDGKWCRTDPWICLRVLSFEKKHRPSAPPGVWDPSLGPRHSCGAWLPRVPQFFISCPKESRILRRRVPRRTARH